MARWIGRVDAHVAGLAGGGVVGRGVAAALAGVDDVRIGGIGGGETGLAAADAVPVAHADAVAGEAVARPGRRAEVLHRARDMVWHAVVDTDVIELRNGQSGRVPGLAAV